jgi:hypothetical protein
MQSSSLLTFEEKGYVTFEENPQDTPINDTNVARQRLKFDIKDKVTHAASTFRSLLTRRGKVEEDDEDDVPSDENDDSAPHESPGKKDWIPDDKKVDTNLDYIGYLSL